MIKTATLLFLTFVTNSFVMSVAKPLLAALSVIGVVRSARDMVEGEGLGRGDAGFWHPPRGPAASVLA